MKIVKMHKGSTEAFDDFLHQKLTEVKVDNDLANKYFDLMSLPAPENIAGKHDKSFFKRNSKYLLLLLLFMLFTGVLFNYSINYYNTKEVNNLNVPKKTVQQMDLEKKVFESTNTKIEPIFLNRKTAAIDSVSIIKNNSIFKNLSITSSNKLIERNGTKSNKNINPKPLNLNRLNTATTIFKNSNVDSLENSKHFLKDILVKENNLDKKPIDNKQVLQPLKPPPAKATDSLYIIW